MLCENFAGSPRPLSPDLGRSVVGRQPADRQTASWPNEGFWRKFRLVKHEGGAKNKTARVLWADPCGCMCWWLRGSHYTGLYVPCIQLWVACRSFEQNFIMLLGRTNIPDWYQRGYGFSSLSVHRLIVKVCSIWLLRLSLLDYFHRAHNHLLFLDQI